MQSPSAKGVQLSGTLCSPAFEGKQMGKSQSPIETESQGKVRGTIGGAKKVAPSIMGSLPLPLGSDEDPPALKIHFPQTFPPHFFFQTNNPLRLRTH